MGMLLSIGAESELTIGMLTREMLRLTAEYMRDHPVEFDGNQPPEGTKLFQKQVQLEVTDKMLSQTLDDVAEREIHPLAHALADNLKHMKIKNSYALHLNSGSSGLKESFHILDGLAMRGRLGFMPGTDNKLAVFDVLGAAE
jgi:hypothetical protein